MSHKNYIQSMEALVKAQKRTIEALRLDNKKLEF